MKIRNIFTVTAACLWLLGLNACSTHSSDHDESAHNHDHEAEHTHGHEHEHDHDHESEHEAAGVITLEPEMAERMGVKTTVITEDNISRTIKASAMITSSADNASAMVAPTSGVITLSKGITVGTQVKAGQAIATINTSAVSGGNSNQAAKAALEAARKEVERLKPLYEEKLVTASEYNAAVAALAQAQASYSPSAGNTVRAVKGGVITNLNISSGSFVNAGDIVGDIASTGALTVKVDLSAKYASAVSGITDANICIPYSENIINLKENGGTILASNTSVSNPGTSGYIPVWLSLPASSAQGLTSGMATTVYLLTDNISKGISVPVTALIEQQGNFFVYKRLDEDCYQKLPVTVASSDGKKATISTGITPGDDIVTEGAITVRLAEASGAIPEGHSHHH
ncbi:MAG: efflux RND transporter periplasmic adaptor subunit [Muribaculaceae bacterium]|nr:efflux RND transporter periplasmic adaptor subunit [Muribaculaceae bacterium]